MLQVGQKPSKRLWLILAGLDHLSRQELDAYEAESGMLPEEWDNLPND
jgi:hypothetical protein